jgi:hypothetical protein
MFQCEQVQAQLIDRLYDLLEPDEVAAFDAHVASCASCSQALTKARQFQELVSRAAKREFPEVRFSPPPAVTPASAQPAAAAPAPPARLLRRVKRLALAAALLLAVTAVTVPTANHAVRYVGAVREVARLDSAKLALRAELQQIEAQALAQRQQIEIDLEQARQRVEQAEAQWQAARDQAVKTLNDRRMYLMVTGPETVQAGAPNDYTIETLNLNNQHVPAKLDIKVSDKKTGEVLYEERDVRTTGQHRVSLPIDLKYGPGSDIALDIRARGEALGLPQTELTDRLLIAAPVYLTHLATDRPLYQPGDTVYFRSLTLNRNTLQPASAELTLHYALHRADSQGNPQGPPIAELTGTSKLERLTPKGREALLGPDQQPIRGIGTGALSLPADAASGWYVLSVREANNRFPTEQRKLLVDAYTPPRLTKQLEFDRKSYGPGDPVVVNLKVARPEGGALAHAKVNATVKVDGNELPPIAPTLTDALGQARLAFQLPGTIERGEAVLVGASAGPSRHGDVGSAGAGSGPAPVRRFLPRGRRLGGGCTQPRLLPGAHPARSARAVTRALGRVERAPADLGPRRDVQRSERAGHQPGPRELHLHPQRRHRLFAAGRFTGWDDDAVAPAQGAPGWRGVVGAYGRDRRGRRPQSPAA